MPRFSHSLALLSPLGLALLLSTAPVALAESSSPGAERAEVATDHDLTVGSWGFQVAALEATGALPASSSSPVGNVIPFVGVRRWFTRNTGLEAGLTVLFVQDGQDAPLSDTSAVAFGATVGLLKSLGVFQHMTVFWEPQAAVLVVLPDSSSGVDEQFTLDARLNIGAEIRLGMIGLERLGLTTRIAAGFRLTNDGNTDLFVGTIGGVSNSVKSLLESTLGFVFYF